MRQGIEPLEILPIGIQGAYIATSTLHVDNRGNFREWFRQEEVLNYTGFNFLTVQANLSVSDLGVMRGIHYSLAPEGQAKWVTCANGAILDLVVDLRQSSPTFKKVVCVELRASEGRSLLIGPGLGHGFISLERNTIISYLLSSPYTQEYEYEINPTDELLKINYNLASIKGINLIMSAKDAHAPTLKERQEAGQLPE